MLVSEAFVFDRLRDSGPVHRFEASAHAHGLDHVVLSDEVERVLRWTARILSLIVLVGFVLAVIELGPPRSPEYVAWEQTASVVALVVAAIGLVLAWMWEQVGSALTLVAGVFVGALAAYQYNLLIALGVALLFMVPAALFLLAWHRTQSWLSVITIGIVMTIALVAGGGMALAFYEEGHGPTHAESTAPPLSESDVVWMWSGAVTDTSAVVAAKVESDGAVRLVYGTDASFDDARSMPSVRRGPLYRFELSGLSPGNEYHYAVEIDGTIEHSRSGTFRTFEAGPQDFTVAFGSCARNGSNASVFDTIRNLEPDLFISTGDFNYGDVLENSLDAYADLFDLTLTQPGQAALYASIPIAYVWDDHDFGGNDAASDSPSREAALTSYRAHVPHYDLALDGPDAPIAQAFTIGRVRFILTDLRSARDPKSTPDGPDKSMLGDEQREWFLGELTSSLEHHAVVVWVSSVPWITDVAPGADHWGGYANEREVIAAAIAHTGHADRLVMIAGDAHMLAIDDGSNHDYAPGGGASFPVIQAAALDRNGSLKGGPYSEGAFPGGGQFGVMEVEDRGHRIDISLRGLTWEMDELVSLDLTVAVGES
jgi:phosphodiesterase/alkaline phosphatase D-like protein